MSWQEQFEQKYNANEFQTDSDIEDFAEENELEYGDVFQFLDKLQTAGTPCEKCKNIGYRYSMYPCNSCTRQPGMSDKYEKEE